MKAMIFDIQRSSFVDGPGIRTTVFFKGCNLKCRWCHSPESQQSCMQLMYYKSKCNGCGACTQVCQSNNNCCLCGKCTDVCPVAARHICGREYTVEEVFEQIVRDAVFYDVSGGGVTFSGGECMLQADFLSEVLKKCKEHGIHTAVDTAGNVPWESFARILPYTDMFLYDLKAVTESLHIYGTGISNKLILSNLQQLSCSGSCEIIVRIPVVPGFNTDCDEIKKISGFLRDISYRDIELLPYHRMGEHKYEALNMEFMEFEQPGETVMSEFLKLTNCD